MQKKEEENLEELDAKSSELIITKFLRKGFEGLSLEDCAVGLIVPNFSEDFHKQTGIDWKTKYQVKALERLHFANFDLQWMTRRTKNVYDFLFSNCARGDVEKVRDFMRKTADENLLFAVDERKRSPLHLAAREGHTALVEFLLLKGFNVAARDRLLKTPLHYAAQLGHDVVASTLMKNGSPLDARDNCGRSAFLYACLGSSPQMITLFLATRPEAIRDTDNTGRKALHYAVYNNSLKQIDIIRVLLEHKCDINGVDEDGFTCLHLAAEGGRVRAIPILLKNGADLSIRDRKYNKTALELAANDRTREVIIVYGTISYKPNEEEKEWMNKAVKGEKLQPSKPIEPKKPSVSEKSVGKEDENTNAMISFLREQFFELMKKIQETGIQTFQHLKRPYLYTGSWMEGIRTIDELYERFKDIKPAEAALRTFNILCPYDKPLPVIKGDEKSINAMYGDPWFDMSEMMIVAKKKESSLLENEMKAVQTALDMTRESLKTKEEEVAVLKNEKDDLKAGNEDLKKQLQSKISELKKKGESEAKAAQLEKLQSENNQLNRKIKELEMTIETSRGEFVSNFEELTSLKDKIDELQTQLSRAKALEKSNRFKAGKLFLKALDDLKSQKGVVASSKTPGKPTQTGTGGANIENLEDDEAIIRMYQALKKTPPGMMQRLKEVDSKGQGNITRTEFTTFCERLNLAPQDIVSLCRVAGFFNDSKKLLGILEFKLILEQRPKLREQWEKFLFKRVVRAIKEKNLTVDQLFDLIDVDSDKKVTPKELKTGFEALKIVLNQQDFNNMFNIFDKDHNKTIELDEMKNTLLYYETLADEGDQGMQEEHEERFNVDKNVDDFEENKGENLQLSDKFCLDNDADTVNVNDDVTQLNGDLKIQIPYGKGIINQASLKEIFIRIRIRGAAQPDIHKPQLLLDKNKWEFAIKVPIRSSLRENLSDVLNIQLYQGITFDEPNFLGEINLNWKICIDTPETWVINNELSLRNINYANKEPMKKVTGLLGIQVRYVPNTSKNFKSKLIENDSVTQTNQMNFPSSVAEEGMLEVTLISCVMIEKNTPIKCDIKLPNQDSQTFPAEIAANGNPRWGKKLNQMMKLQGGEVMIDFIKIKLLNEKSKVSLGDVYVNWQECLAYPCLYLSHKAFLFPVQTSGTAKPNKLYLKVRWIPKSQFEKLTNFDSKLNEKQRKAKISDNPNDYVSGLLKVLLLRGKAIGKDANVDPYCVVKIENEGEEKFEFDTKPVKKTQNPEYLKSYNGKVKFFKEGPKPPLVITVKDSDLGIDAVIGKTLVDLQPTIDQPFLWAVNGYFPVTNDKNAQMGEVYVQCYFVPDGRAGEDKNIKPVDKDGKASLADEDQIYGTLTIRVIHAKDLKAADGKTSDPYCTINLPDNKELKTSTINKTINPIWNETFQAIIKVPTEKIKKPIKFVLKDSDFLKDDMLGMVDVDWKACVEKPGVWAINEILPILGTPDLMGKLSTLGYLYIQMRFMEGEKKIDDKYPPLLENLAEIMAQKAGIWKGTLRVFLVSAKNLLKGDDDTSDPKVVFKVAGGKQVTSDIIKKTLNPIWNKIYDIPVNMARNTIQPMRVDIYDDDLMGDDFLGYTNIILEECFTNPGKWAINKEFDLDGTADQKKKFKKFGNIYLQIMYVIEGNTLDIPTQPLVANMTEEERKKMEMEEKLIQGIVKINLVMARNLRVADAASGGLSDPYCVVQFPDEKTTRTKTISKNVDPIWNFEHSQQISTKYKFYKPIKIQVMDDDTLRHDELGVIDVDWMECIENPGLWMVNNLYKLTGEKKFGRELGDIYVQMRFLSQVEAAVLDKEGCPTVKELVEEYGRVIGKFNIQIIKATGLYNSDFGGKSDPFCVLYLSAHPNESIKTGVIKDCLDPEWNDTGKFLFLDVRRKQTRGLKLVLTVLDEDTVTSEVLGSVEVNLIPFLLKNELEQTEYPLKRKGKDSGNITLGIQWNPDPRCETLEKIEDMDKTTSGEIMVRVPCARKLKDVGTFGKTSPYVEIYSSLDKKQKNVKRTKSLSNNLNPDWTEELNLQIIKINEDDFLESNLVLKIKDTVHGTVGGIEIPLKALIEKPGTWYNEFLELVNEKGEKGVGWANVQIQFKSKNEQENQNVAAPMALSFDEVLKKIEEAKPKPVNGNLVVNVIGAKNLRSADVGGKSDPFCKLQLSDQKIKTTFKTKTISNCLNPIWNAVDNVFTLSLLQEDLDVLKLYVYVYDYDAGSSDDFLGQYQVDLSQAAFSKPGQWCNKMFPLLNKDNEPEGAGMIYLQIQWRPDGLKEYDLNVENKLEKEMKEAEEAEKKKKEEEAKIPKKTGKFEINIISAIGLKNKELIGKSDPYCVVSLSKGEKKKLQTPTINDCLDPIWNLMGQFLELSLPETEFDQLKLFVAVFDYDTGLSSDSLGGAVIDMLPLVHEPGKWLNDFTPLINDDGKQENLGQVYIQIRWLEEGFKGKVDPNPPEILKAPREKPKEPTVKGELFVKVVCAQGLKDDFYDTPDCYVKVFLSQGKGNRIVKTPIINDNLNPVWNHEDAFQLDISKSEYSVLKMFAEVYDNDYNSDDFIGKVILDIGSLFEKPGSWQNNNISLINKENTAAQGSLYIMAQWRLESEKEKMDKTLPESKVQVPEDKGKGKKQTTTNKPEEKKGAEAKKVNQIPEEKKGGETKKVSEKPAEKQEEQKVNEPIQSKKEAPKEPGMKAGILKVTFVEGKKFPSKDLVGASDPFCQFKLEKANPQMLATTYINNNNDPVWNHTDQMKLYLPENDYAALSANLEVWDYDDFGKELIGKCVVELGKTIIANPGKPIRVDYDLVDEKQKPVKNAKVTLEMTWTPA